MNSSNREIVPAPWLARQEIEVTISGGKSRAIVVGTDDYDIAYVTNAYQPHADLISAAPTLLHAAESVLQRVESEGRDTGMGGAFSWLRDAVAMAKGESIAGTPAHLETAERVARIEAKDCGVNQYVFRNARGDYAVTDTPNYYRDEREICFYDRAGVRHEGRPS